VNLKPEGDAACSGGCLCEAPSAAASFLASTLSVREPRAVGLPPGPSESRVRAVRIGRPGPESAAGFSPRGAISPGLAGLLYSSRSLLSKGRAKNRQPPAWATFGRVTFGRVRPNVAHTGGYLFLKRRLTGAFCTRSGTDSRIAARFGALIRTQPGYGRHSDDGRQAMRLWRICGFCVFTSGVVFASLSEAGFEPATSGLRTGSVTVS
jgi:hypothetical protein